MNNFIFRLHVSMVVGVMAIWLLAPVDAAAQQRVPPRGPQVAYVDPINQAIGGQERTTMAGLVVGLTLCVVGAVLSWKSLTQPAGANQDPGEFTIQIPGAQARLSKAMPGAVLFLVGVAVFWITRYEVTM